MKCQQCDNPAVFHITELEAGNVREVHLCEEHARVYLNHSEGGDGGDPGEPGAVEGKGGRMFFFALIALCVDRVRCPQRP